MYVADAVERLAAHLEANLATHLRAVETDAGLSSGTLANPLAYLRHEAPAENRVPLVEVFDDSAEPVHPAGERHGLWATSCTVMIKTASDADIAVGAVYARHYVSALLRCIRNAPTLGTTVVAAFCTDLDQATVTDKSTTRYVYAVGVEVHTYTA
ncbi:MAG: hypothetical protein RL139_897 [Gemmatimonadota bacterium]|jgi:hypothetical protein